MIFSTTSDVLRIVTSSTADIDIEASWADNTTTTLTGGGTGTKVTTAATTVIVAAPAASTQRQIKTVVIKNIHASTSNTVTVQHYNGSSAYEVFKRVLAAGESVAYDGTKWITYNSTGNQTIITSAGDALVSNPLSQFAATTSAQLAGVISDETGSGALVFGTTPTLTTPVLGVATATSVNKVALTAPATAATLTIADGATLTVSASATITNGTHSGTNTGDQTNVTGNAATVTIADAGGDTTTFPLLGTAATGDLSPATDAGLTYNATTNALTTTTFIGALTGTASGNLTSSNIVATITNGVTTNAPSEDAVFDALALKAPLASPTFTGTVTIPVALTGVVRADSGVLSVDTDVTDIVAAGTSSAAGKLELATDAETVTGTDTARATTPANITAKMSAPGAIGNTTPSTVAATTLTGSTAGNPLTLTNSTDSASVQVGILQGDRATIADGDEAYVSLKLSDSAGNQDEGARVTWKATTVLNGATQDTDLILSALVNNVLTTMLTLDGSASEIVPAVAINSAANITGAIITTNTGLAPDANDGAYLGTTALQFSDLFLAEGGVINFDNGDVTITQVGNTLTITGGSTIVDSIELGHATDTTIARSGAGAITVEGVQVLLSGAALGTPASGTVTNLTGTASININGTVGATTPAAGTFTTVTPNTSIILQENAPIILDPALSADGKYSGITMAGTAGATLAFGDLCYLAAVDSRWELADADAEATAGPVKLGICVLAAAGDGSATTMLLMGTVRADAAFPALTISAPAYVSTTAGDIQVAAPSGAADIIRVVGWANTADELYFNPSGDWFEHA